MNKYIIWTAIIFCVIWIMILGHELDVDNAQISDLYQKNIAEVKDMQTLQAEVKYWNDTQGEFLLQVNSVTELMQTVQSGIVDRQKLNNL